MGRGMEAFEDDDLVCFRAPHPHLDHHLHRDTVSLVGPPPYRSTGDCFQVSAYREKLIMLVVVV